jgi:predicted dinucleotide-binding enzyme
MNVTVVHLRPLTTEVKRLASANERIARALEHLCVVYGITLDATDPAPEIETEVTVATDYDTALREAMDEARRLGVRAPAPDDD